jgi:hypothetical protein
MSRAPIRGLFRAVLLATLVRGSPVAEPAEVTVEYVDSRYHFAFEVPVGWERQELPTPGEAGEVRLAARNPGAPMFVIAVVRRQERSISPGAVERAPDRQAILDGLIEQALGQTHGKMARDLAASQTVVIGTHRRPSAWGLVFAIDTTHVTPEGITAVSGFHVVPFEKPYAIALLLVSRGASTRRVAETRSRLFDSFRIVGARLGRISDARIGAG